MATDLEASRLMVRHGANLITIKDPNYTMYCAMAKKFAIYIRHRQMFRHRQRRAPNAWAWMEDTIRLSPRLPDRKILACPRDLRVHQILKKKIFQNTILEGTHQRDHASHYSENSFQRGLNIFKKGF